MKTGYSIFALFTLLSGCSHPASDVASAPNELGIVEWQTDVTGDDFHLLGLDASHAKVAELILLRAHIVNDDIEGDGRMLHVQVFDKRIEHASVGLSPIELPLVKSVELDTFLTDVHVSAPLAQRGVTFATGAAPASASNEIAFGDKGPFAGACTHEEKPGGCRLVDAPVACCETGDGVYEDVCCTNVGTAPPLAVPALVKRSCLLASQGFVGYPATFNNHNPPPPGTFNYLGTTSACGANGAYGCAPCWSVVFADSCDVGALGQGCTYTVDDVCHCDSGTCKGNGQECFEEGGACICRGKGYGHNH